MFSSIRNFYKESLHSFKVQVGIPSFCAFALFSLPILLDEKKIEMPLVFTIGAFLILYTLYHGHLITSLSKEELDYLKNTASECKNKMEESEWKNRIYMHLIEVTNQLVNTKRNNLDEYFSKSPIERFAYTVNLNLSMLYEFYKVHSIAGIKFKIVFFIPSPDKDFLIPYLWYNEEFKQPASYNKHDKCKERFSTAESEAKVCYSWRTKELCIIEDAENEQLMPLHSKQKEYLKTMITYPILDTANEVIGVISFTANKPAFFLKAERDYHHFIFEHFSTRIVFEYDILKKSEAGGA